jgi:Uma2 family endonuclease
VIYEDLGVREYWVIDVRNAEILAFAIADPEGAKGSYRIERSQVITGLEIGLLAEALRMSRQQAQGQVTSWLLAELQQKS